MMDFKKRARFVNKKLLDCVRVDRTAFHQIKDKVKDVKEKRYISQTKSWSLY